MNPAIIIHNTSHPYRLHYKINFIRYLFSSSLFFPVLFSGLLVETKVNVAQMVVVYNRLFTSHLPPQLKEKYGLNTRIPFFTRPISSKASEQLGQSGSETRKDISTDISTVEDPFDAPTYHVPEKPVTFVNAEYYAQPREYEVFNKALKRIKDDDQVSVRIGSPITGYGKETEDRLLRHYIPHSIWTDEDGVEHVEINFYIRGPHGVGKVYTEMFKDPVDKQYKCTLLIVVIISPTLSQLILESNVDTK